MLGSPWCRADRGILRASVEFRYLAIEGPPGVGASRLAERLGARLDATVALDERDNPFLADFYAGRVGAAFQAQLFFLLSRHRQQTALKQTDLFSQVTVADYLFDRDRIYGYLNLDDNELFIYQRLFDLLSADVSPPDLVVYLQAPAELLRRRYRRMAHTESDEPAPTPDYLKEVAEAYNHFFFHYAATPLLVVETSQVDLDWGEDTVDDLIRQIASTGRGTRYYVPRTGG